MGTHDYLENAPAPPDAEPKGSKDPRDCGDNGNRAQSAGRVTAQQQNAHPASPADPTGGDPSLMPDSLGKGKSGKPA